MLHMALNGIDLEIWVKDYPGMGDTVVGRIQLTPIFTQRSLFEIEKELDEYLDMMKEEIMARVKSLKRIE